MTDSMSRQTTSRQTTSSQTTTSDDDGPACCICLDTLNRNSFFTEKCEHGSCYDCIRQYLEDATRDPRYQDYEFIFCPGLDCKAQFVAGELVPKVFKIKKEADAWWSRAITRAFLENSFVCPFDDCKEVYDAEVMVTTECVFVECEKCHRGFCLTCRSKWHSENDKLVADRVAQAAKDLEKMMITAEKEGWCRCPRCKEMVQRASGCDHMSCRCGAEFCYKCGSPYKEGCIKGCHSLDSNILKNLRKSMYKC